MAGEGGRKGGFPCSPNPLALLRQMARGVAAQFGSSCEVVIHDLTAGDLEHTVVHIENGHVSGRKPGDGPSKVVLDLLQAGAVAPEDRLAYLTRTPDGKVLRSSSLFIAGPDGQPGAVFAINYDISALVSVEQALHALTDRPARGRPAPAHPPAAVNELLEELIRQSVALVGKPGGLHGPGGQAPGRPLPQRQRRPPHHQGRGQDRRRLRHLQIHPLQLSGRQQGLTARKGGFS